MVHVCKLKLVEIFQKHQTKILIKKQLKNFIACSNTCTVIFPPASVAGLESGENQDPLLIVPIFDRMFCCLPSSWRRKLWCSVPHDEVELDDTGHALRDPADFKVVFSADLFQLLKSSVNLFQIHSAFGYYWMFAENSGEKSAVNIYLHSRQHHNNPCNTMTFLLQSPNRMTTLNKQKTALDTRSQHTLQILQKISLIQAL